MTDTEILDYLNESIKSRSMSRGLFYDFQIGWVAGTIDTRKIEDIRAVLIKAIQEDQHRRVMRVARELTK